MLRKAADFNWTEVEPAIFGSLLQGALGKEKVWAFGAHYTAEADILKVVIPTVVEPWRERVASCDTLAEAQAVQHDLMQYVVLDPACGSGNFLYVAYRELRRIEADLRDRATQLRKAAGLPDQAELNLFPIQNMKGIELEPFAVKLARVTMWIGHKLAVDKLRVDEPVLPLVDLSGIRQGDALHLPWPRADAIISNPPYHGSQMLRRELGDKYVEWLKQEFGIGVKDYAAYWFRKAHPHLSDGGRAGLVVTNSISQNRNRKPTLEWILDEGAVITNAISTQDWSGEAAVDVSIVNWVKHPPEPLAEALLDGTTVAEITAALRPAGADVSIATQLAANAGRAFQGPIPVGDGFVLSAQEAEALLARPEADYAQVVRPYLVGDDIANNPAQRPTRWIVDLGFMTLEAASRYPAALEVVKERVKPVRDGNRDRGFREKWWRFGRPRGEMREVLSPLSRYIAGTATGKRILFCWAEGNTCPSNAMNVFAFDDDFAMGVLLTSIHHEWARAQSSTLEDRIRYTPTSAFETFPWPTPTTEQRGAISEIAKRIIERRQTVCVDREIGLTQLYNELSEGAYADLRGLHDELDRAVAAAYGWPASVASDANESNRRLLELNQAIAAGEVDYSPFS